MASLNNLSLKIKNSGHPDPTLDLRVLSQHVPQDLHSCGYICCTTIPFFPAMHGNSSPFHPIDVNDPHHLHEGKDDQIQRGCETVKDLQPVASRLQCEADG